MRTRSERPLLDPARVISVAEARDSGLSPFVLRDPRWAIPFHGVRASEHDSLQPWHHIEAYAARMPDDQFFSHTSAALVHGLLVPRHALSDLRPHISTRKPHGQPRCDGVQGHQLDSSTQTTTVGGRRVTSAPDTWCQLVSQLQLDDLIALGDLLVTGLKPLTGEDPPVTFGALDAAILRHRGQRGIRVLRVARESVRFGSLSPMETKTRLAIVRAGLPEPELNFRVIRSDGTLVAMLDLAYPDYGVGIEYEGDGHRDHTQFRKDITRYERLKDEDWSIIRITVDDLFPSPYAFLARLRHRLRSRGAPI